MDLVFSFFDTIVVRDADDGSVDKVLDRLGAVRRPDHEDWYDLPLEPVFARLPYDPDRDGSSISPKLCALGTAQVGIRICNFPPQLRVFVVLVYTTLHTSRIYTPLHMSRNELTWRELVCSPGRTVLYGPEKSVDWSLEGPAMAVLASTGRSTPEGLDLSLLCKRRIALLRRSMNDLDLDIVRSVDTLTLGASLGDSLYLSGSSIEGLDLPLTGELVDRISEATADRKVLDVLLERLRRVSIEINHWKDDSRFKNMSQAMDWIGTVESELRSVSRSLDHYSHLQNTGLSTAVDRRLRISQDANRCISEVAQANHDLASRLALHTCMAIQGSIDSVSYNMESSIENLRIHVGERSTEIETRLAARTSSWHVWLIYLVCGATLLAIASAAVLDIPMTGLALIGCGLTIVGLVGGGRKIGRGVTHRLAFPVLQSDPAKTNNAARLSEDE